MDILYNPYTLLPSQLSCSQNDYLSERQELGRQRVTLPSHEALTNTVRIYSRPVSRVEPLPSNRCKGLKTQTAKFRRLYRRVTERSGYRSRGRITQRQTPQREPSNICSADLISPRKVRRADSRTYPSSPSTTFGNRV